MLALIKKSCSGRDWIFGYCGTPSEVAKKFIDSGVQDQYQQLWMQTGGNIGEASALLNNLLSKCNTRLVERQDIEGMSFALGQFSYSCIGCAETAEEAQIISATLETINAGKVCSSQIRQRNYDRVINVLQSQFEQMRNEDLHAVLSVAANLCL